MNEQQLAECKELIADMDAAERKRKWISKMLDTRRKNKSAQ